MKKIAIIIGEFHREHGEAMLDEAQSAARELHVEVTEVIWVPGALETPLALKRAFLRGNIDGAVALGIIERGETSHGFVMGSAVTSAIIALQLECMKPVGVGILGPDIVPHQIPPRARPYARAAVNAVVKGMAE